MTDGDFAGDNVLPVSRNSNEQIVLSSLQSSWGALYADDIKGGDPHDPGENDSERGSVQSGLSSNVTEESSVDYVEESVRGKRPRLPSRKSAHAKTFSCDYCDRTFSDADIYKEHKWIHADAHPIPCSYCRQVFTQKEDYRIHVESNHRARCLDKICATCRKLFLSCKDLEAHIKATHLGGVHVCKFCGQVFPSIKLLSMHVGMQHNEDTSATSHYTRQRARSHTQAGSAVEISASLPRKKRVRDNMLTADGPSPHRKHREHEEIEDENEKAPNLIITLPRKQKSTSEQGSVQYTCEFCTNSYKYAQDLKNHMWMHADVRPIPCRLCSENMQSKSMYRSHLLEQHFDECRDKYCETCRKMFICVKDLTLHIKTSGHPKPSLQTIITTPKSRSKTTAKTDEANKPFRCPVCKKVFERRDHLNRHQVVHTGDKPYECSYCVEKFSRKDGLKRHIDYKHGNTQRLHCSVCDKKFSRSDKLKLHMLHQHKDSEDEAEALSRKRQLRKSSSATAKSVKAKRATAKKKEKKNASKGEGKKPNNETHQSQKSRIKTVTTDLGNSPSVSEKNIVEDGSEQSITGETLAKTVCTSQAPVRQVQHSENKSNHKREETNTTTVTSVTQTKTDTAEPRAIKMHPKMRAKKALIQMSEAYTSPESSIGHNLGTSAIHVEFDSTDHSVKMEEVKLENGSHSLLTSSAEYSSPNRAHMETTGTHSFDREARTEHESQEMKSIFGIIPSDETLGDSWQMASVESILATIPTTTIENILYAQHHTYTTGLTAGISPPRSVTAAMAVSTTTTDIRTDTGSVVIETRRVPSSGRPVSLQNAVSLPVIAMHDPVIMDTKPADSWSDSASDNGSDLNDTLQNIVQQLEADDTV